MNTRKPYPPAILSSLQLPVRPWLKNSLPIAHPSGSDTSSLHITVHKLDGKNYLQWAQSMKIVICGRGKLGYITSELPTPNPTDLFYKTWLAENSIVLASSRWTPKSAVDISGSRQLRRCGMLLVGCTLISGMLLRFLRFIQS